MILKPPPPEKGDAGLDAFRADAKLYEDTLKNRTWRALYRGDLAKWQKLYATLSCKREPGSPAATHFAKLSKLCGELLTEYGPEAPAPKRPAKTVVPVPFLPAIADFYLTNPIARASKVMAECSALAHGTRQAAAE